MASCRTIDRSLRMYAMKATGRLNPFQSSSFEGNIGSRGLKGMAFLFASQALNFAAYFVSLAVMGRLLSPASFGIVAMAGTVVTFAMVFRDLGFTTSTVQREEITHE